MDVERPVSGTSRAWVPGVAACCGLWWGLLVLFLLSRGPTVVPASAPRVAWAGLTLPLHAAGWLSGAAGLSVIDPSGLILAAGAAIGLAVGFCLLAVGRFCQE